MREGASRLETRAFFAYLQLFSLSLFCPTWSGAFSTTNTSDVQEKVIIREQRNVGRTM